MKRSYTAWIGIIVASVFAAIIVAVTSHFVQRAPDNDSGVIITSEFFVLPALMGIICAWFMKDTDYRLGRRSLYSLILTLIALALSALVMGEGVICLIIVSPILFGGILLGNIIGWKIFKRKNNTLNFSFLSLFVLVFVADLLSPHHFENIVSDVVTIKAPPETVWKYVAAYEPISEKPDYWLFNIGMPCPVNSTVDAYKAGAGRKCIFSNGYVFDEVMTVYDPAKELTFKITKQPRDPEIMGHIDILQGQFLLKDNGDGTTTLTGNSWYRLYVFPSWYYNIWAQSITRNVHLRVMNRIKQLSEQE